jgi:uncharacterized membrane protein YjdF
MKCAQNSKNALLFWKTVNKKPHEHIGDSKNRKNGSVHFIFGLVVRQIRAQLLYRYHATIVGLVLTFAVV